MLLGGMVWETPVESVKVCRKAGQEIESETGARIGLGQLTCFVG